MECTAISGSFVPSWFAMCRTYVPGLPIPQVHELNPQPRLNASRRHAPMTCALLPPATTSASWNQSGGVNINAYNGYRPVLLIILLKIQKLTITIFIMFGTNLKEVDNKHLHHKLAITWMECAQPGRKVNDEDGLRYLLLQIIMRAPYIRATCIVCAK
jgi:hypothetical protein